MKDGAFEEGEFNRSLSTIVYVCAILTIVSFWLIQLESVLKPFFIALAVYFVLKPGADALSANGFPLVLSYFTMLMGFFAVVGAAGFFAYVQADTLMSDTATVEEYNANLEEKWNWLRDDSFAAGADKIGQVQKTPRSQRGSANLVSWAPAVKFRTLWSTCWPVSGT